MAGSFVRRQVGPECRAQAGNKSVSLLADPDQPGNRLLRMTSATDGTGANTQQSQICHQRKYLEGTYAARVRFVDLPTEGPGGDQHWWKAFMPLAL
mgnify:CR=1 FL=1